MTSDGSPYARFRRALLTGNVQLVDAAARELGDVSLEDALKILTVLADKRDERYSRAAARWAARATTERRLTMPESRYVMALVEMLPHHGELALAELHRMLRPAP